jgi:hypothetical protein
MVFLTSVLNVAFPAFAEEVRNERGLKEPYLRALGALTVFYWPAVAMIALLAHPIVSLLLGEQWLIVVPVLQVIAVAYLAWFPDYLTTPLLLAVGANRDRALVLLLTCPLAAVVLCSAAYFGIMAMAMAQLVTVPYMMFVALYFVRRHVAFRWREVGAALWRSAIVLATSAAGPIGVVVFTDRGCALPISSWRCYWRAPAGWPASWSRDTRYCSSSEMLPARSRQRRLRGHRGGSAAALQRSAAGPYRKGPDDSRDLPEHQKRNRSRGPTLTAARHLAGA